MYVGKLSPNTTCDDIRCHLTDIHIGDVNDVIKLNGRNKQKESSFCLSFNSEVSMVKSFVPEIWPAGVIVRPFRPARSRNRRGSQDNGNTRPRQPQPGHQRRGQDIRNTCLRKGQTHRNDRDARAWQAHDDYHVSDSWGYDYGYDYGYVCDYDY